MTSDLHRTPRFVNGGVSFWYDDIGLPAPRPGLPGDIGVDVAIVGAGFTGLWAAYYLKRLQPDLRIAVLERDFAGFGASGRNGGWLSAEPPGQPARYAKTHGVPAVVRLQRHMCASVDEVIRIAAAEQIEAGIRKSGMLRVGTTPAQLARIEAELPAQREFGWDRKDLEWLDAAQVRDRVRVAGALGGTFTPHCARIQPAMLVRGLADAVERSGVSIYEQTAVTDIAPGVARTELGLVRADYVIRAVEGFTPSLRGEQRTLMPMNSSMIVTEPLPQSSWDELGWREAELVSDDAHAFAYCQRTHDGRIALGGRGVPYRFGSRWDDRGVARRGTFEQLRSVMRRLFPPTRSVGIDHLWTGVLGVSRDWCASVGLDAATGLGWAGGYVGHGVTSANLAGRTLADLVLRRDTELVGLPWVGRRVRKWEPEPARWIGVRGLYLAYHAADRRERAGNSSRTSLIATAADVISGR